MSARPGLQLRLIGEARDERRIRARPGLQPSLRLRARVRLRGSLRSLPLLAGLALSACAGEEFPDLDRFMDEQRARTSDAIAPVPPFRAYQAFAYSAATLRSPFDPALELSPLRQPQSAVAVPPDPARPRELLEQFTLDSLALVGKLSLAGTDWALLRDPAGGVHRVEVGNFLGRNHGTVVALSETAVAVVEIVADDNNGWVRRTRTIELQGRH